MYFPYKKANQWNLTSLTFLLKKKKKKKNHFTVSKITFVVTVNEYSYA
jgi:hypothetical protein